MKRKAKFRSGMSESLAEKRFKVNNLEAGVYHDCARALAVRDAKIRKLLGKMEHAKIYREGAWQDHCLFPDTGDECLVCQIMALLDGQPKEVPVATVRWHRNRWKKNNEAAEKLAKVVNTHYPTIAGRVIRLQEDGEEKAAAEWNKVATAFYTALAAYRERMGWGII